MSLFAYNFETIKYNTWSQFKSDVIKDLFSADNLFSRGTYLFRGHKNADWMLTSSFDRAFNHLPVLKRNDVEMELLKEFSEEMERSETSLLNMSQDQILAFAQHYGLPTRLLDWTQSPYIAAFFAFSDLLIYPSNTSTDYICIWVLEVGSKMWSENLGARIFSPPVSNNIRLRNQMGYFTHLTASYDTLEQYVSQFEEKDTPLKRILIPQSEAKRALSELDIMGINHSYLLQGSEGVIRSARLRVALTLSS